MLDEMKKITKDNIAPCGMNCGVCKAYLREKNPCHGCNDAEQNMPVTRVNCKMRTCRKRHDRFCFSCSDFPCDRLKHLDLRYRTKYKMSEIENLKFIKEKGINAFVKSQQKKYQTSKGTYCVHDGKYYN